MRLTEAFLNDQCLFSAEPAGPSAAGGPGEHSVVCLRTVWPNSCMMKKICLSDCRFYTYTCS